MYYNVDIGREGENGRLEIKVTMCCSVNIGSNGGVMGSWEFKRGCVVVLTLGKRVERWAVGNLSDICCSVNIRSKGLGDGQLGV